MIRLKHYLSKTNFSKEENGFSYTLNKLIHFTESVGGKGFDNEKTMNYKLYKISLFANAKI